jgi:Flp pilus assembly protein TadG
MRTRWNGTPGRRGFALMYCAIALTVLTVFCGLAVDATVLFMVRAKLSSAVDAAALAGARSVNLGSTQDQAQTSAYTAADTFFVANFPSGYLGSQPFTMPAIGSSNTTYTPTFTQSNATGLITMSINASVQAPVYFMRILGFQNITVTALGTAKRRALVMMLVLDISSSMGSRNKSSSCDAMVAAAQSFVTLFSPYDEIGLITFDLTAHLKDTPTTDHGSASQLYKDIGNIACGSNTNTISALDMAYQQIKAQKLPLALNTIVLFTDGSPNAVTANFPARTQIDTRWGPAMNSPDGNNGAAGPPPPAQSGSNSCNSDQGSQSPNPPSPPTDYNEKPCVNMPAVCTVSTDTIFGSIAQWGDQNSWGATTVGMAQPADYGNYSATNNDGAVSIPHSCDYTAPKGSGNTSVSAATNLNTSGLMRQYVAYIPDTDFYGNNLKHGVAVTAASPSASAEVLNNWDTRENWLHQVNQECNPANSTTNCKNTGAVWSPTYSATGSGNNFFTAGAYSGFLRPDQPNTIVAASMNGAMSEAYRIRSDATYNPVIHTIYLTGNGYDSVDHEFLPIIANVQQITALPYDLSYIAPPGVDPALYPNPAYQSGQQMGRYFVTSDKNSLSTLFAQLASEVLRLSQ